MSAGGGLWFSALKVIHFLPCSWIRTFSLYSEILNHSILNGASPLFVGEETNKIFIPQFPSAPPEMC